MTPLARPTALTEEELIHVENLEKIVHEQGVWARARGRVIIAWWARESLAIIRRLDARVGELACSVHAAIRKENDCCALGHTITYWDKRFCEEAAAERFEEQLATLTRERDALRASINVLARTVLDLKVRGLRATRLGEKEA